MARQSDEDRLIQILQHHKALKHWTMNQLQEEGIPCQETYGNDEKGDIVLITPKDGAQAQTVVEQIHQQFNNNDPQEVTIARANLTPTDEPHLEIKTQYLYGQEVDSILEKKTVVGIVSANKISKPSRQKLITQVLPTQKMSSPMI